MSSSPRANRLPRRRNGKEQACEPCRLTKIACDHSLPVCHRCIRRKVPSKCVYLPAPMTRPGPDYRTRSEPASSLITLPPTPSPDSSSPVTIITQSHSQDTVAKPTPESSPFIKAGGFFGEHASISLSSNMTLVREMNPKRKVFHEQILQGFRLTTSLPQLCLSVI